jgi:putative Holliday junction resolvase
LNFFGVVSSLKSLNYLGIDYGSRRIGLAIGDGDIGVATPVQAIGVQGKKQVLRDLEQVIKMRHIHEIVIGYPYNMNGSVGFKAKEVDEFVSVLEQRFSLPVHRVDERLTTHQVECDLKAAGRKTKTDKKTRQSGEIDSRAAALILQDYLSLNAPQLLPDPFDDEFDPMEEDY